MADVGTGTTIAFGTSGFSAQILGVDADGIERAVINTSHMSTTGSHTKMPGDLKDEGEVVLDFAFDPNSHPPITAAAETITITFPIPSGMTNGATLQGSGFISKWKWGSRLEEKMTGSATITWAGAVAKTNAS